MGDNDYWYIGVILQLVGSTGQNLGNNLVSLAHSLEHKDEYDNHKDLSVISEGDEDQPTSVGDTALVPLNGDKDNENDSEKKVEPLAEESVTAKRLWLIGTIIFAVGSLVSFGSFGFAAQSLLASLESVQFVSNIVFAKLVHKETVTWSMIIATAAIIGGNALVVVFSSKDANILTGKQIFNLWATNTTFHIYLALAGSFGIACEFTYRHYCYSRKVDKKLLLWHATVEPVCYSIASAVVGAFAVVNAKGLSMMINSSATGENEFVQAPLWVILITWLIVAGFWLGRLDGGLELFQPLFFIPVIQVFFVFFSIVCGGIFFKEFNTYTGAQYGGFIAGVLVIFLGVGGLAPDNELEIPEGSEDHEALAPETLGTGKIADTAAPRTDKRKNSSFMSRQSIYYSAKSSIRGIEASSKETDMARRRTRRLSYVMPVVPTPQVNENAGSVKFVRANTTTPHPFAALKEARRRASTIFMPGLQDSSRTMPLRKASEDIVASRKVSIDSNL